MPITRTPAERRLRTRLALQRIGLAAGDPAAPPGPGGDEAQAQGEVPTSEAEFLAMMIGHHQEAIAMAQAYLALPEDQRTPQVADLANGIVTAQTAEIDKMQGWLDTAPASGAPAQ